jgi:hypothetical protein
MSARELTRKQDVAQFQGMIGFAAKFGHRLKIIEIQGRPA